MALRADITKGLEEEFESLVMLRVNCFILGFISNFIKSYIFRRVLIGFFIRFSYRIIR